MEEIVDIVESVVELASEGASSHKVPKFIRILLQGIIAVFYLGVTIILLAVGTMAYGSYMMIGLFLFALALGPIALLISTIKKIFKEIVYR